MTPVTTDAQTRLDAAWSALASPAQDRLFRIRLLEQMERRLLHRRLALALSGAAALAALAIAVAYFPHLGPDVGRQLPLLLQLLGVGAPLGAAAWAAQQMRGLGVSFLSRPL